MRVVIDTNVFIHGMLSQHHDPVSQACRKIMKAVADEKIQLVVNPLTAQELIYVFSMEAAKMPKLYRQSIRALATFVAYAEHVEHATHLDRSWIHDVDDAMFIECAVDAAVSYIVSDDYSLKRFAKYNLKNGNLDALQFLNEHHIEIHDPESLVANVLR